MGNTTAVIKLSLVHLLICLSITSISIPVRADHSVDGRTRLNRVSLEGLDTWITSESIRAKEGLCRNISPPDAAKGVVVASPSRHSPDYYYYWVRDAALVMNTVLGFYERSQSERERSKWSGMLQDYVHFSLQNQLVPNPSGGLGEPKFEVDGSAFVGEWGRPQNDGAALRAITLIRYARHLLTESRHRPSNIPLLTQLYDGRLPSQSVIKRDLEFISHHWRETSFDLWEEIRGQHFYTRIVQRRALVEGASLAERLGDFGASDWYRKQAKELEKEIHKHWNPNKGYLVATLDQDGGISHKVSGIDVAIVLGSIHAVGSDHFYSPSDDKVLATALKIRQAFQGIYEVNRIPGLGTAIGRYPEDVYDGYSVGHYPGDPTKAIGNPWVLTTHAFAELYFRVVHEWKERGRIEVTEINLPFLQSLKTRQFIYLHPGLTLTKGTSEFESIVQSMVEEGDKFFQRVRHHTPADGSMSEQINRYTGYMQGAPHLTWSYGSFFTARWERDRIKIPFSTLR